MEPFLGRLLYSIVHYPKSEIMIEVSISKI